MSKLELQKAIIDDLRTDTGAGSLVTLTGHTASKHRIARDMPAAKERTPFLGVLVSTSVPAIGSDVTHLQRSQVSFNCYSRDNVLCEQIADRMEILLHDIDANDPNVGYYDFSNAKVSNRQTRFKSRNEAIFDSETEVWTSTVEAVLLWINGPCPVP